MRLQILAMWEGNRFFSLSDGPYRDVPLERGNFLHVTQDKDLVYHNAVFGSLKGLPEDGGSTCAGCSRKSHDLTTKTLLFFSVIN